MHVNVKKLVYAGLCLAISMALILLEGVFGMSTLFLLSLSGFFAGIVIRESGFKMGVAYIVASIVFNILTVPMVLIFPQLLLPNVNIKWMLIAIVLLQPAWFIGDKAYDAFQTGIWNRIRSLI